jgi:hypothetical protein
MSGKAQKLVRYIDRRTGETKDRVQFIDLQFDDDGYLWWSKKTSVKTFVDMPLPKCFTWSERGRIHELKHYMLKDNQFLVYRSDKVIKPITVVEMCKILGISQRQCGVLIKKMKAEKIIKEISFNGSIYFAFNPIYGFKGKRLNLTVFMFFQNELMEALPNWVIDKFSETAVELRPMFEIIK